jgi:regulatory protein
MAFLAAHRGGMSNDPAPPDMAALHQAALTYLSRYASTEAGVRRVLHRRIDRWAKTQPDPDAAAVAAARTAVDTVVLRLLQAGVLNDTVFAETRAKSLLRGGQSSRSVQGRLIAKGVAAQLARDATPSDPETELAAALVMARRRRIGPYRPAAAVDAGADAAMRLKELGRLARAGFSREIAQRALDMTAEEAETRIREMRR